MTQSLSVRIITPQEVVFQGQALSVSSVNSGGKFDILPMHANFITLIKNSPIIIHLPHQAPLTFNFPLAIVYNFNNHVNIYADIQLKLQL